MDTPWLIELRPRWSLITKNVEDELSADREKLQEKRIPEEQWYYPDTKWTHRDGKEEIVKLNEKKEKWRKDFSEALGSSLCNELRNTQSDSFYICKPWRNVRDKVIFEEFRWKTSNINDDTPPDNDEERAYTWGVLQSSAWRELPWRGPAVTKVRDVNRDLQQILTTQSYRMRGMLQANRHLLEAYFPGMIETNDAAPFSYMVLESDQAARWGWFCWSLGLFIVVALLLDLNATSWHGYYADQIGETWINAAAGVGSRIPLAQLRTTDAGLPYHLINGTIEDVDSVSGKPRAPEFFLFSQEFAGSELTGYRRMSDLDHDNYNLASAIAISGGAVDPKNVKNPLQKVLLFLFNMRLGRWILNPGYQGRCWRLVDWFGRNWMFSPVRFLINRCKSLRNQRYCFVTDGGLTENLGIQPLIRRRCKVIFAMDAGQDGRYQFHDLGKLLRWLQVDEGVEITWMPPSEKVKSRAETSKLRPVSLSPVMATPLPVASGGEKGGASSRVETADPFERAINPDASQHFLVGRIEYPGFDPESSDPKIKNLFGYLVYMKSTICPDDPVELVTYQQSKPLFPHESTIDLGFSPVQFETYRHLGETTVEATLKALKVPSQDGKIVPGDLFRAVDNYYNNPENTGPTLFLTVITRPDIPF